MKLTELIKTTFITAGLFCALTCISSAQQTPDPFEELKSWQFGKSRETLFRIEEIIRSTKPDGYAGIERKLIAALKSPDTAKDAKRYICRWLGIVGSQECVPAVAELLTDPDLSHPARMALEPMNNPLAGAALRDALSKVDGKLLAGVISSLGVRRDAQSVPILKRFLPNPDPIIAEAAILALGQIGNEESADALESFKPSQNLERARERALITAASRLAEAGLKTRASAIYKKLFDSAQSPATRMSAVNGLANTLPRNEAVIFLLARLQDQDEKIRASALSAYRQCPDLSVKNGVAEKLPQLSADAQLLLLGILADLDSVNVRAPALKVLQSSNDDRVRSAALECLARHGEPADVKPIAEIASKKSSISDSALRTLQRMNKPGVDDALVKLIESSDSALRAVALNALSNRRVESAIPTLVRLLKGNDAGLAVEAAKGLAIIGTPDQTKELASIIAATENRELRDAASSAIKAISRKAVDKSALSATILASLNAAKTVPARSALLQLLVFTGGETALKTVVNSLNDPQPEIKTAAFNSLVAWNDDSAAPYLLDIARNTADEKQAVVALRDGCLRIAEMDEIPINRRVQILQNVIQVAKRVDEKKRAISLLGEIPSPEALKILQTTATDPSLKTESIASTIKLARQIGALYPQQALSALEQIKAQATDDATRKQAEQAISAVKTAGLSPDGFILAWLITPYYTKEGKDGSSLFNEPFPPELGDSKVDWRPCTVPATKKNSLIEFDKMPAYRGDNRVVYLKTIIVSDSVQDAQLQLGSDDGIKVWLNGKVVHQNNAVRPCVPGQDKAKIRLVQGENTLMIKLTQGGGEWAVCCKICAPDGKELTGITISPKN